MQAVDKRQPARPWLAAIAATAMLLTGCTTVPPLTPWRNPAVPDFRQTGPIAPEDISVTSVAEIAVDGCVAEVELHAPAASTATAALVFAHGFLHEIRHHRELAQHLARWGVPTYLVGLCRGGWLRGGVPVFAKLMRAVAAQSRYQHVIYGGFSAGGSAAYLAALDDSRTVGLLGLDPVGHGIPNAARRADFPAYGLFGPANVCNAQQSGRSLFGAGPIDVVREIDGATHCHFESPTDMLCRVACGEPGDTVHLREIRSRIYALATAYLRWRAGLEDTAPDGWWNPTDGVVSQPGPLSLPLAWPAFTH